MRWSPWLYQASRRATVLVTLAVSGLAVRPAHAQGQHKPLADVQIQMMVEHELIEKDITGVNVAVKGGSVTLSGTVKSLWAKTEAIERAREANDVQTVVSDLMIARAESDDAIAKQMGEKVRRYVFYTIFDDISGTVNNGVVTLTGRVTLPYKSTEIAAMASTITGVQDIRNEIKTLPVSQYDEQLRVAIAAQIYRDPLFWNYAIQVNPPIHIVVENSRVTLTGIVRSEVERRKAEIIARSTFGVIGIVENKLEVEGRKR